MRRIASLFMALALCPSVTHASNWVEMRQTGQIRNYYDSESIIRSPQGVLILTKSLLPKPIKGLDGKFSHSSTTTYIAQCETRKVALLASTSYADASGTVVVDETLVVPPERLHVLDTPEFSRLWFNADNVAFRDIFTTACNSSAASRPAIASRPDANEEIGGGAKPLVFLTCESEEIPGFPRLADTTYVLDEASSTVSGIPATYTETTITWRLDEDSTLIINRFTGDLSIRHGDGPAEKLRHCSRRERVL